MIGTVERMIACVVIRYSGQTSGSRGCAVSRLHAAAHGPIASSIFVRSRALGEDLPRSRTSPT
jgi:hypothetical protein